jgi:hypothetical protein
MANKRKKLLLYVEWWFLFLKNMAEFIRKNPYPGNPRSAVDTDYEEVEPEPTGTDGERGSDQEPGTGGRNEFGERGEREERKPSD